MKGRIFLSLFLILTGGSLAACQTGPALEEKTAAPALSPTPTLTSVVTPLIETVPVDGLFINEDPPRLALFNINTLAYELPGMDEVEVINFTYAYHGEKPLTVDVYYPPGSPADVQLPAVVFGIGYRMSKLPLRNEHFYTSWGKLVAAAGMIGIVYDTEQPDQDLETVMAFVQDNAEALRIDPARIGLMSSSSNVPTVMSYLMQGKRHGVRFSVYYYGLSITHDHKYNEEFALSCSFRGCLVSELADGDYVDPDLPLFIVKAGKDKTAPNINEAMDHFVDYVRGEGAPVTVVDYVEGRHGFDTLKVDESADIIAQTLDFMLASFEVE